ncbi:nmrA-like family protein [Hirsutella rhossiliensis]|uniref:NmrA-like family domain-containing protein n=1 Tax=Hirsutella rhossiliensis TaxID=111463 RepID=A0A9P8SMD9_9HYPO|nr:nmrA-like family domain-containing protein [Hirsutella rhossiliensis]KAH0966036.1 nmrA-like family domain-containing protein [Hirsutella rhossiliensis]
MDQLASRQQQLDAMMESVLIIGAGELGLCVIEALAAHPQRNRMKKMSVLVRAATLESTAAAEKQQTVQRIRALGAEFETADVVQASVAELAGILSRYGTVVSCSGMELPAGTQTKLAQAALAGRVRRYFPWQFGMDYEAIGEGSSQHLFDEQLRVRAMLREATAVEEQEEQEEQGGSKGGGTEWVIVSTGLFMSFLFVAAFGVVDLEKRTVRALGGWEQELTATTPRDIGRATAEVVVDPREIRNQVVYTAGDTISYARLADTLDGHFGGAPFRRELWDAATLRRQVEEADGGEAVMARYRDTFAQGRGVAWGMDGTLNAQRGMAMTDVDGYLREMGAGGSGPEPGAGPASG